MRVTTYVAILSMFMQVLATPALAQLRTATKAGDKDEDQDQTENLMNQENLMPRALEGPIDPDTYVLGPLDDLLVVVHGAQTQRYFLKVLPEGNIVLPNAGPFHVAGMTLTEFREAAAKQLQRYYPDVEIDIQLAVPRTFVIYVTGEVNRPGAVEVYPPFRVSNVIRMAGGVKEKASRRQIEIRENGEVVHKVDLFAFLNLGMEEENVVLHEGQSVYVPPAQATVNVVGEVRLPGLKELIPGETASDMIEYCGGIDSRGFADRILLERTRPGQPMETILFDMEQAKTIELEDLDILVIRDIRSYDGSDPVEVIGGGGRGGAIYIGEPEPLRDFLARLWRFTESYDTRVAVLEHETEDGPKLTLFDVGKVFAGDPVGELLVRPGDTVSFPPRDSSVFVAGEIVVPGPLPYQPGYTAERYISLAGGPNDAGSFDKLTIYSRDGVKRSGDRSSMVYRGDTIVLETRTGRRISGWLINITSLTGLILSIVALSRTN